MLPTLEPGDRVVVVRSRRLRPGMLVALRDPRQPDRLVIKRVSSTTSREISVLGDNPAESTDSRTFGSVPIGNVAGRVVYRYHPPGRAGRVP